MIKILKNQVNDVIFTLTEKESQYFTYSGPDYKLNLTNCQTIETISDIQLYDLSLFTERFNEFYISLGNLLTELTVTSNTTLVSGKIYFIDGDITVNLGKTLTIPDDTYIIQSSSGSLYNSGTIINEENIIADSSLDTNKIWWISSGIGTPMIMTETTYLFTLVSGYYDYSITTNDKSETLEIGKLLVDADAVVVSTYNNDETTYTYQG